MNTCRGCGKDFRSVSGFDKHRVGRFGVDRRCMSTGEMLAVGLHRNTHETWAMQGDDTQLLRWRKMEREAS